MRLSTLKITFNKANKNSSGKCLTLYIDCIISAYIGLFGKFNIYIKKKGEKNTGPSCIKTKYLLSF